MKNASSPFPFVLQVFELAVLLMNMAEAAAVQGSEHVAVDVFDSVGVKITTSSDSRELLRKLSS